MKGINRRFKHLAALACLARQRAHGPSPIAVPAITRCNDGQIGWVFLPMCRSRFLITLVLAAVLLAPSPMLFAMAAGGEPTTTKPASVKTDATGDSDQIAHNPVSGDQITSNSIELSLAVGIGRFESPVVYATTYEFHALPQLAWYGERAFFENGLFGYALQESVHEQWDLVLYPNADGLFFNLNGGNIIPLVISPTPFPVPDRITVKEPPERDVSAMAGLRYSQQGEWLDWHLQLGADISGVHNGWELASQFACPRCLLLGPVQIGAELGITLKGAELVEYYYMPKTGEIDPIEGDQYLENGAIWRTVGPYHGEHGWLVHAQLHASWELTPQWALIATYREYWLSDALTDTPLLARDHFAAYFGGLQYRF
jgi:MipA family protein